MLVEFHQHATGLHVPDRSARCPNAVVIFADMACAAMSKPPTAIPIRGAVATRIGVVVAVVSGKHPAVGVIDWVFCRRHRITGVSAVPGHCQLVLTNLITDGERRVFSRVPQTRNTLDLLTAMSHSPCLLFIKMAQLNGAT